MAVSEKEIEVGKCYVTPAGQVRRVTKLDGSKVTFEARGTKAIPRGKHWPSVGMVERAKFAQAVDREVRADYDPDYPEKKPV